MQTQTQPTYENQQNTYSFLDQIFAKSPQSEKIAKRPSRPPPFPLVPQHGEYQKKWIAETDS